MPDGSFSDFGRTLMVLGGILLALGVLFSLGGRVAWLGRLPGDIVFRKGSFTFYFPVATSLLLSLFITLLLALWKR